MNEIDENSLDESVEDYEILDENESAFDLSFKVIIIGNSGISYFI